MEELEKILREHGARYPAMEPRDVVKLIYQNEFGGGHMIVDEQAFMSRLRMEYESIEKNENVLPYEPIGDGLVRVHLAELKEEELETLGKTFIQSAAEHKGNPERFLQKLELLRNLTKEGTFRFSPDELEQYLTEYKNMGYPMVSHSVAYRKAYKPAYRIIRI